MVTSEFNREFNDPADSFKRAFDQPLVTSRLIIKPGDTKDATAIADFCLGDADNRDYWKSEAGLAVDDGRDEHALKQAMIGNIGGVIKSMERFPNAHPPGINLNVYKKDTGQMIGAMRFWHDQNGYGRLSPAITPSERDQHQHYGREAYGACLAWATEKGLLQEMRAEVASDNEASLRLLRSFGFEEKSRTSGNPNNLPGGERELVVLHKQIGPVCAQPAAAPDDGGPSLGLNVL
jgi:RimJ/RimL family protein N-acetyltransferase